MPKLQHAEGVVTDQIMERQVEQCPDEKNAMDAISGVDADGAVLVRQFHPWPRDPAIHTSGEPQFLALGGCVIDFAPLWVGQNHG